MPIPLSCPGCSKKFRVADEHAGKRVKCPSCHAVFEVPRESPLPDFNAPSPAAEPVLRPSPYVAPVGYVPPTFPPPKSSAEESQQTLGNVGLALGIVALVGEIFSGFGTCCCGFMALGVVVMLLPAGLGLTLSLKSSGGLKTAGVVVNSIALALGLIALVTIGALMLIYGGLMAFSLSQSPNQPGGF